MPRFQVTISEMYNAASKIHQAAEDYLSTACKVYACAEVLGQSWEGDSQVAFMEEQRKAVEWFKKMASLVESYVQMIQRVAKAYEDADRGATGAINDRNWSAIQDPITVMLYGAPNVILNPSNFSHLIR